MNQRCVVPFPSTWTPTRLELRVCVGPVCWNFSRMVSWWGPWSRSVHVSVGCSSLELYG